MKTRIDSPAYLPVDRLVGGYLLVTATALAFPNRPANWPVVLLLHLAGALLMLYAPARRVLHPLARLWPAGARFVREAYPLLLLPALYAAIAGLNRAVYGGHYFDEVILRWEQYLFGGQPSQTWATHAPWLGLSEFLHGAYLSYYFIILVPPLVLYFQRRTHEFRVTVFSLLLVAAAHYLFFIFFPVQGPRYLFAAPSAGAMASGPLYQLTHKLLAAGSSQGAAFPSSHVGISVGQSVSTARFLPRWAPYITLLTLALAAATVYGGFHYLTDAVVGGVLGFVVAQIGQRVPQPRPRPVQPPLPVAVPAEEPELAGSAA